MSETVYQRRVRPFWVAYCVLLVGAGVIAVAVGLGVRLPLLVLAVVPIVLMGLALLLVAALPARKLESAQVSPEPVSLPAPDAPAGPSETESCQP